MIGYVTVGTRDLERARVFFDKVLAEVGAKRTFDNHRQSAWRANKQMLMACIPYDENDPSVGNGTMVALQATSREHVAKVWQTALDAGASDEGAPGFRTDTFYGAYFRDPDGNKFCVHIFGKKDA